MHAVVIQTAIQDPDEGLKFLHEQVVPFVSNAPGFVAAYWARLPDDKGIAMLILDSEQAARALTEQTIPPESAVITFESIKIGEIVADARATT